MIHTMLERISQVTGNRISIMIGGIMCDTPISLRVICGFILSYVTFFHFDIIFIYEVFPGFKDILEEEED